LSEVLNVYVCEHSIKHTQTEKEDIAAKDIIHSREQNHR